VKSRFKTFDNHFVEGVLIPTEERKTLCFFTDWLQFKLQFCAHGKMERERNLTFDEIFDQVL
jgi:23S rRNA (adenine2503-C2)-methyltransferase